MPKTKYRYRTRARKRLRSYRQRGITVGDLLPAAPGLLATVSERGGIQAALQNPSATLARLGTNFVGYDENTKGISAEGLRQAFFKSWLPGWLVKKLAAKTKLGRKLNRKKIL